MTVNPNRDPNPNSNSQDKEFLMRMKEITEKLRRGERIELSDIGLEERIRAEELAKKKPGNFNVAIRVGEDKIKIRSGGYEVDIRSDKNKITIYGKDGRLINIYNNECLTKNVINLLMAVLAKYGVSLDKDRWYSISLPRTDRMVRRLQSWLLAVISNFAVPLKHNPLICG
jgi:hypothetical protein